MSQYRNPNPMSKILGLRPLRALAYALAVALLAAGCSTAPAPVDPPGASDEPLTAGQPNPAVVGTVILASGDTIESVEESTGGTVLVWAEGSFALVGMDEASGTGAVFEDNLETFESGGRKAWMSGSSRVWAGGASRVWAGGASQVWGGGSSTMWSGGEFSWMPENTDTWNQIGLENGQRMAPGLGYGVKVAIIDTGIDLDHPALMEALAPREEWWDFYGDDRDPDEEGSLANAGYGHGTNVAGIVRQIAPRATILPLRVLGPDGDGNVIDVAAAIHWAVEQGADVINLSLGTAVPSMAVRQALRFAHKNGVLVVASTGNTDDNAVTFPASMAGQPVWGSQMISVTSVDRGDLKSSFSTYGNSVELAAPGEDVYGPAPELGVAAWTGTSMAAPMAAGALALALGEGPAMTTEELADSLLSESADLYDNGMNAVYLDWIGDGRLDVLLFSLEIDRDGQ